jgi:hypothetical protein
MILAKNKETCQLRKLTGLKMQVYKPGSVFRVTRNPYHLSGPAFTSRIKQSTHHAMTNEQFVALQRT